VYTVQIVHYKMGTVTLFGIVLLLGCINSQTTRKCLPTMEYRSLNGGCSSLDASEWGVSGKLLSVVPNTSLKYSSAIPSIILAEPPEIQDPVTEWLGAWASFIKSDLLNIGDDYRGLMNVASSVLDLSNLYGTSGDTINIDPRIIGDNWDISEKVLWKLFESEHYRLSDELSSANPGWSTNKIHQEARRILIGEYENIIINEVAPLLIGLKSEALRKAALLNTTEDVTPFELVLGVHIDLALSASDLHYLETSQGPLDETWRELALRMLDINLVIPDRGITMDKLNELSDARDLLNNIGQPSYTHFKADCGIHDPFKHNAMVRLSNADEDALIGGLLEEKEDGAVLSPTLSCAFERVLSKVISGDRFWFSKSTSGLTKAQIANLQTIKLTSLICANMPYTTAVQPNAFLETDADGAGLNSPVLCTNTPALDLDLWIEDDLGEDLAEDAEVAEAITAAKDRLLEFRRYEYDLFNDNFVAARGNGLSGLSAVTKPSIQVLNAMNTSTLFELVTYEFLRRPKLSLMIHNKATPRRIKRHVGIHHHGGIKRPVGILNKVYHVTPINIDFDNKIMTSLETDPEAKIYYKTGSTKRILSSHEFEEQAYKDGPLTFEISTREVNGEGQCDPTEKLEDCSEFQRFRSYSGWCNNENNPDWGTAMSVHRRLLPSEYDDRISKPRTTSVRGSKLPSPRLISQKVHYHVEKLDPKYTLMLMQWGQFIDHDLTHTPTLRGFHSTVLDCGDCESKNVHPACFPIHIPEDDDFYSYNARDPKCIPFSRSVFGQQTLGPREQVNQLTSYLDASMVYGSNECEMRQIREAGTFKLKMFSHPLNHPGKTSHYKSLLPRTRIHADCFSPTGECFMAGDSRVNEQPGLTCMHTVLVREHNKIAEKLSAINPHWDVNMVFEETRRIITAQIQHITYNEFLPRVLGLNSLSLFDVDLRTSGYFYDYDDSCSATSFTEFSTAAFRFGHSMIRPNITAMSEDAMQGRSLPKQMALRQHFNKPDVVMEANMIDDLLRGLAMIPMETIDSSVTNEVTNHLFEQKKPKSGMDLVSLNIQRARDHGIPGYNKYREVCQLSRAHNFFDLIKEIKIEIITSLQSVYKHPDDIDLFTGLLSETRLPGALTGPTLACIIGLQFKHLRKCDRYWYETSDPKIRFSEQQLQELRSANLAALICSNMEANNKISRSTMDQMDRLTNPLVDCEKTIKHIDLEAWRETPELISSVKASHIISKGEAGETSHTTVCQIRNQSVKRGNRYRVSPCTTCQCTAAGVKCETVNLAEYGISCLKLVKDFGIKKVEEDESCRPQCRII
jgi:peroxidase